MLAQVHNTVIYNPYLHQGFSHLRRLLLDGPKKV